ncbi:carbonic anhydrase family protein [Vibrio sp. T187]|uniref:carbonic anhydrase n=1 Tax=Vibrio TaxID=662 RepID=UPI0010C96727|nr:MULTISPECIES: carbonic anhydrase family protein [Vibrio]MBW3696469.1 carbonic anhydrase family protein [Vibrio sp. T187]
MKTYITTLTALAAISTSMTINASEWGYSGKQGPEHWHGICQTGKNQSPIDISKGIESELEPIKFNYDVSGENVVNNGHTIQVNFNGDQSIEVEGKSYSLLQFHFHAPSENLIKGHSYPLEVHLVHADENKNLAVVGVMFEEGATNPELEKVWDVMPANKGQQDLQHSINLTGLLPKQSDYFRFNGSLTTPPCSEGVTWLVMKNPITISKAQLEKFRTLYSGNNRPTQDVNARPVLF